VIPGIPKVHLHNKVLAYETGEDFLAAFRAAARGELEPFVLVIEGSIPNEKINGDGFWSAFGNDLTTGQPKTLDRWIDELAPKALAVMACGTCATYGGIPRDGGQPDRRDGPLRLPRPRLRSKAGLPIINVPGARCSRTTSWRRCSGCCSRRPGTRPMIPLDDQFRPTWLFGKTVHEGCSRAGYYEQAGLRPGLQLAQVHRAHRLLGPGGQLQRPAARLDGGIGGCPNVGGICIACTMPGFPDRLHAVHGRAARRGGVVGDDQAVRACSSASCARSPNTTANKEPGVAPEGSPV
jgi:hydrogenase small subunit